MDKKVAICLMLLGSLAVAPVASAQWQPSPYNGKALVVAQNGPGSWNGFHGEQGPRDGFRRGPDGWWYPLAAFAAGAIVGGAVAGQDDDLPPPPGYAPPPPPPGYASPREYRAHAFPPEHYVWCAKRYRSYVASDNSYVPRAGFRAQCRSPYS
jgi:hypothetical protein